MPSVKTRRIQGPFLSGRKAVRRVWQHSDTSWWLLSCLCRPSHIEGCYAGDHKLPNCAHSLDGLPTNRYWTSSLRHGQIHWPCGWSGYLSPLNGGVTVIVVIAVILKGPQPKWIFTCNTIKRFSCYCIYAAISSCEYPQNSRGKLVHFNSYGLGVFIILYP